MVVITLDSGDGYLPLDPPIVLSGPSARAEHPIAALFRKVTGKEYSTSSHGGLVPDDPYCEIPCKTNDGRMKLPWSPMRYVPSTGDLNLGLQRLYEIVHGVKPNTNLTSSVSSAEDYAEAKKAGQEMVMSIEDKLGHPVRFLELGAGVALNTIQASELRMEAYAIELRMPLVAIAQRMLVLGRAEGVLSPNAHVTIVHGNYFPKDILATLEPDSGFLLDNPYAAQGKDAYDILGHSLADFQFIYNYPWPNMEDGPFFQQFLGTSTHAPCIWQTPQRLMMVHAAEGLHFPKKSVYAF